ncbi:MAG: response regulator transcription factor [Pseudobdellovibrio sp.]
MFNRKKVLIVDDEYLICQGIAARLSDIFEVFMCTDIESGFKTAVDKNVDALVTDVHIGKENGMDLCQMIRKNPALSKIPIIVMTGFSEKSKLIASYQMGADHYLEKPVDMDIIKVTLLSSFKRIHQIAGSTESFEKLNFNFDKFEVEQNGKTQKLSQIEMKLLRIFIDNYNKKLSREEIAREVWQNAPVKHRTIDVHISGLRKKMKAFNYRIVSVYSDGYIFKSGEINIQ